MTLSFATMTPCLCHCCNLVRTEWQKTWGFAGLWRHFLNGMVMTKRRWSPWFTARRGAHHRIIDNRVRVTELGFPFDLLARKVPMTTSVTDDAESRVRLYQDLFHIDCWNTYGHIVVRAIDIGAVTAPIVLGRSVRTRLRELRLPCPIIEHDSNRWTFLTRTVTGAEQFSAVLLALDASIVDYGAAILLPSPMSEASRRRCWVDTPAGSARPETEAIVRIVDHISGRRALAMRSGRHYV